MLWCNLLLLAYWYIMVEATDFPGSFVDFVLVQGSYK